MAPTILCHAQALQAVSIRERVTSGCSLQHATAFVAPVGRLAQKDVLRSAQLSRRGVLPQTALAMQPRADVSEKTTEAQKPELPSVAALGSWGLGVLLSAAMLGSTIPAANAEIVSASMLLMPGSVGIGGPEASEPRSREKEFIVTFQKTTPSSVVDAICYEAALGDLGSSFSGECVETKFTDSGNFLLINTTDEDIETLKEVHATHIASIVLNQPVWIDEATEVFCGPFYGTECTTQGYL